ncbi:MAG: hypothetical protein E6J41_01130 [Chloroflexi bacterium]|nr:MAG: hypothetical protein E6J41_01130 [Chloroflexota bacterium]
MAQPTQQTRQTATATAPPVAPLTAWQGRGATEVPPPDLQQVSMEGIQVVNQTGAAVSDADANSWAAALLRGINYEFWAVERQQDGFLRQSGLSSAPAVVFSPDLTDIDVSRKAKTHVKYTRKVIRRMVLRSVPASMQATFTSQLAAWKPYAFYLDAVGPATKVVTDATGRQTTQTVVAAGTPAFELVGGEIVHDPLMGDIFAFGSDWNCLDSANRLHLAPLCNQ